MKITPKSARNVTYSCIGFKIWGIKYYLLSLRLLTGSLSLALSPAQMRTWGWLESKLEVIRQSAKQRHSLFYLSGYGAILEDGNTLGMEVRKKWSLFPCRNWNFIYLPRLSRFNVGSPPYIKAMIIFLTTLVSVRGVSGKHCKNQLKL